MRAEDDPYAFDVEEFTKKTWEWNGEISIVSTDKSFNKSSAAYAVKFPNQDESKSQDLGLKMGINSRWDWDWSRLYISGEIYSTYSTISEFNDQDQFLNEGYWQLSNFGHHSFEIGKRLLRWGKGYAFNPVAILERPKNPDDPESNREGLWMVQGVLIPKAFYGVDSYSVALVFLPVRNNINSDYRSALEIENIWGLRLYALIGTTDLDFYYNQWTEKGETDLGVDFSSNLTTNFEVHGEYLNKKTEEETSYQALLGLRYLTSNEITWIIEGYHDSSGMRYEESSSLYKRSQNTTTSQATTIIGQLQKNKTINQNYSYIKASIKEPFNWLYLTPSLILLSNLDDSSHNITSQFNYAPGTTWIFQVLWQHFTGRENSQYGESLLKDKIEVEFTYSF